MKEILDRILTEEEEPKLFDANKPSESFISQVLYTEKINKLIP